MNRSQVGSGGIVEGFQFTSGAVDFKVPVGPLSSGGQQVLGCMSAA